MDLGTILLEIGLTRAETEIANWLPPDPIVPRFYQRAEAVLLDSDCPLRLYVGYLDDVPVATAELAVGGGVVGLYNISTRETHRRRGFGSRLTLQPLQTLARSGITPRSCKPRQRVSASISVWVFGVSATSRSTSHTKNSPITYWDNRDEFLHGEMPDGPLRRHPHRVGKPLRGE